MAEKKEYVEKETLINIMLNGLFPDKKIENPFDVLRAIKQAPTADVAEVKHGRWLNIGFGEYWCSVCDENGEDVLNKRGLSHWKRCPNCGAKMDGKPQKEV